MGERDWYGGVPASTTVLILGEVFKDRPPATVALQFGQAAYEGYQAKAYLDGLLLIRHHETYVDWSPLFSSLYAGIVATGARLVVELGSTLFATIDKLEKVRTLLRAPVIEHLSFVGIEPSTFFCQLAEALHPTTPLRHVPDLSQLPPQDGRSVNRCYQASSYAFATTAAYVEYCTQSDFGCHGVWFSHDGATHRVAAMGKPLTLFSVTEFVERLHAAGYTVEFIQRSHSAYATDFEFFETWLVYHKLTPPEQRSFSTQLDECRRVTGDTATLHPSFDAAPLTPRADSATQGLAGDSRILDFTSADALQKLEAWWRSLSQ